MKQFGVGVIGAGFAGSRHALGFHCLPETPVKVVCDLDADLAQKIAGQVGAEWTTDFEEVTRRSDIDVVVVANSDPDHLRVAMSAIRHRKHMLLEKPVAMKLEEAEQIVAAARQAGIIITVGHVWRFDYRWWGAKEAIDKGEIGQILSISGRRYAPVGAQQRAGNRVTLPYFLGVHEYDMMRWMTGSEITRVYSQARYGYGNSRGIPAEDTVFTILNFANGVIALSDLSWVLPAGIQDPNWSWDIVGERGSLHIASRSNLVKVSDQRSTGVDLYMSPFVNGYMQGSWAAELRHFVDCLANGTQPLVSVEDGLAACRVATAVEESMRTGQPVDVAAVGGARR